MFIEPGHISIILLHGSFPVSVPRTPPRLAIYNFFIVIFDAQGLPLAYPLLPFFRSHARGPEAEPISSSVQPGSIGSPRLVCHTAVGPRVKCPGCHQISGAICPSYKPIEGDCPLTNRRRLPINQ